MTTPYEEGEQLGRAHAHPDSDLDPRWSMADHAKAGTLTEFKAGFDAGYEAARAEAKNA